MLPPVLLTAKSIFFGSMVSISIKSPFALIFISSAALILLIFIFPLTVVSFIEPVFAFILSEIKSPASSVRYMSFLAAILVLLEDMVLKSLKDEPIESFTAVKIRSLPVILAESSEFKSNIELPAFKVTSPSWETIVFTLILPVFASISVLLVESEATVILF